MFNSKGNKLTSVSLQVFVFFKLLTIIHQTEAKPLFFSNPFASARSTDDSENVSVYTTSAPNVEGPPTTHQPTVYHQIARNVLERIASPIVRHFVLVSATSKPSNLLSTTLKPSVLRDKQKPGDAKIEILDDVTEEAEEIKPTTSSKPNSNEAEEKETINPLYVASNPSFNTIPSDKPERIVLSLDLKSLQEDENIASEVNDLNKNKDGTIDYKENEIEIIEDEEAATAKDEDENKSASAEDENKDDSKENSVPVDNKDDNVSVMTSRPSVFQKKNFSESGLIYFLELIATVNTLVMGAIGTLFNSNMKM